MKYFIIAGEHSGDKYGALLMKQLKVIDPKAVFKYWGGPQMTDVSDGMVISIRDTSFMGFWEVAKNARKIKTFFKITKKCIDDWRPDIIIFIDYPGFNLRMMKWSKLRGYKTAFYISPQMWAWKKNRYKLIKEYADKFYIILPFEKQFFKNLNTPFEYYGHPILDSFHKTEKQLSHTVEKVGLFPGSRIQEVEKHGPALNAFISKLPEINFTIAAMSSVPLDYYQKIKGENTNVMIAIDLFEEVTSDIDFAIASSGTATLELALHHIPQIVIYKTSNLTYWLGKKLIDIPFISLVNLISEKQVVTELIQEEVNVRNLLDVFKSQSQKEVRTKMIQEYRSIKNQLGNGLTSQKIANSIFSYLSTESST